MATINVFFLFFFFFVNEGDGKIHLDRLILVVASLFICKICKIMWLFFWKDSVFTTKIVKTAIILRVVGRGRGNGTIIFIYQNYRVDIFFYGDCICLNIVTIVRFYIALKRQICNANILLICSTKLEK